MAVDSIGGRTAGWADLEITLLSGELFLWYGIHSKGRAILMTDIHGSVWGLSVAVSTLAVWPLRLLICCRRSVLVLNERCLRKCMLAGPGSKREAKYILAVHCSPSLLCCAIPVLLSTFPCLASLQAVWWLCQRGGLCELCCQAEVCAGKRSYVPQGFLLLQWLRPPNEALWTTQWGLVCERVSIWILLVLPCTNSLPIPCPSSLQNKLTIWQRQKNRISSLHTCALPF